MKAKTSVTLSGALLHGIEEHAGDFRSRSEFVEAAVKYFISGIHCDELVSLPKSELTRYVGMLPPEKIRLLDKTLQVALQLGE